MSRQNAQLSDGVSFKSLDSESIGAARAAARAAGMSLEDWLSRTILDSVRANGGARASVEADDAGWAAGRDDPGETIDAITRHLMQAQAAADRAGVSVAEWLSRTILDTAKEEHAAANSNVPGLAGRGNGHDRDPDGEGPEGSQEDRLARIIASRRAELEAEERAKQPDLLAGLEMPERPMTLTKNMQMPNALPRFEVERTRRIPWLWLAVMLLMVAVAAMIWLVPHLPGPEANKANETTVAVGGAPGGGTGNGAGDMKPPGTADARKPDTGDQGGAGQGGAGQGGAGKDTPRTDATPPAGGTKATTPAAGVDKGKSAGSDQAGGDKTPNATAKAPATALPPPTETRADKMPKPVADHLAWYRKAADRGNVAAQFAMGSYFIRKRDMKEAAAYMRKAADRGHAEAQYTLGALYAYGLGVPKSDVDAVLMYKKAAAQGYVPAITEVGLAYLHGRGVERNLKKAFVSLERAAEADEPNAQYTLGRLYESGIGVEKDKVTAFKWFILAAENKHQLAASRVEDLSIDLSREQRERGAEMVREHKQRFPKKGG